MQINGNIPNFAQTIKNIKQTIKNKKLMKKIFTLLTMALLALGMNAESLIDFAQTKNGITVGGTCEFSTVKIHTNTDSKECIKFANGYTTESKLNENLVTLEVEGGFKAGDVVSIAGVFNNSDESKSAAVALFVLDSEAENGYTVLWTTDNFINGRTVAADPAVQTFTLTADADKLFLGRNGNTGTCVTTLKVVRGEESTIGEAADPHAPVTWDFTKLSDDDASNLAADATNWTPTEEESVVTRYANKFEVAKNAEFTLTANGAELEFTKGLIFSRTSAVTADKIRVDINKRLGINANNFSIKITGVAKDDEVKIRYASAKAEDERGFSVTNGTPSSFTTASADAVEQTITVSADGDIILTTTAGVNIFALSVNDDLPEYTGISVINAETEGAADAPVYNLSGQRVDENYRGVVIKNGRKVVNK